MLVGFGFEVESEEEVDVFDVEWADGEVVGSDFENHAVQVVGLVERVGVDVACADGVGVE